MTTAKTMPESDSENKLESHLTALRHSLLLIIVATALMYPVGYFLSPFIIRQLVLWCFPPEFQSLHYFTPMEVFWVQLKLAFFLALIFAYPWNLLQIWNFLLPGLYPRERYTFGYWIILSSLLFVCGVVFCITIILPFLISFSLGFSSLELQPLFGLANFLSLAGWLSFSFGLMFQTPIFVLLAVHFKIISSDSIRLKRPYIVVVILILSAILTPPDVVSQILLALPTWLLFELGLLMTKQIEKSQGN